MFLFLSSMAMGLSVFLVTRLILARGGAQWHAERTARRSDFLHPEAANWKRTLLGVTGHIFARFNELSMVVNYKATLRRDNIAAAYPWNLDEDELLELAEILFVGVTLLALIGFLILFDSFSLFTALGLGVCAAFAPGYIVGHKSVQRRIAINRALPFSLDLMVLTMEAGSTFQESIETLIDSDPDSPMGQEFTYFLQAKLHGKTRHAALAEMAERVGSNDLTPVVDAVNTAEELGTSIGKILRIQAEGIRGTRSQRAEKLAAEASSKILFPTLLIMVAVLLMMMGPVIIKAVRGDLY